MRHALEQNGHTVREVDDGNAGLKESLATPADLVITDIDLPLLNGLELIATLRRWGYTAPILAVSEVQSGSASDLLFSSVLQGASAFLPKPVGEQELARMVSELLALYHTDVQHLPGLTAMQPEQPPSVSEG